jgi:serine/threonine protein phosphatase PrpC
MNKSESDLSIREKSVNKINYDVSAISIPDATIFPDISGLAVWKNNFDRIICNPQFGFFGAIDGAGKTPETLDAARIVRRDFQKSLKSYHLASTQLSINESQRAIHNGYINAKEHMRQYIDNVPEEDKERLKNFTVETTATVIDFVNPEVFNFFHIGDSRLYIFNKKENALKKLTRDQSYLDQQEINSIITSAQNKKIQSIMDELQSEEELDYLILPNGKVIQDYTSSQYKELLSQRAFPVRNAWENKRFLSSSINIVGKENGSIKTYHVEPDDLGYLLMSDGIYENIRQSEMYNASAKLLNPQASVIEIKEAILDSAIGNVKNLTHVKRMPDDMSLIVGRFKGTN